MVCIQKVTPYMNFICYMLPDQAILQKHGFMHCRRPAAVVLPPAAVVLPGGGSAAAVSAVVLSRGGSGAAGGGTGAAGWRQSKSMILQDCVVRSYITCQIHVKGYFMDTYHGPLPYE